jgi:hypothetical protein
MSSISWSIDELRALYEGRQWVTDAVLHQRMLYCLQQLQSNTAPISFIDDDSFFFAHEEIAEETDRDGWTDADYVQVAENLDCWVSDNFAAAFTQQTGGALPTDLKKYYSATEVGLLMNSSKYPMPTMVV